MVLAQPKPRLIDVNGKRLSRGAAKIAIVGRIPRTKPKTSQDELMAKRAKLMLAAKMNIYVTEEVPEGQFTVIDPEALNDGDRLLCPFRAKTLVIHPNDLERATEHFTKEAGAQEPARGAG